MGATAFAVLGVLLTLDVWRDIAHFALNDEESSHILLLAAVVPWLLWVRREQFAKCRPGGTWIGPTLVALGAVTLTFGYDYRYESLWHAGAVIVVLGCLFTFIGRDALWRFLPAFAALAFLVPVPGRVRTQISIPLQNLMAAVTEQIGQALGFAISRSGNMLMINDRSIEIAEACNGMRMVFAFFLVSYTLAFLAPWRWSVRIMLIALAPVLALAFNVLRMLPTVWLYGYGSEVVAEAFHDMAGWLMVAGCFLAMMGLLRLLEWAEVPILASQKRTGAQA